MKKIIVNCWNKINLYIFVLLHRFNTYKYYYKLLKNDYDYDYKFLLDFEKAKLERMIIYFQKYPIAIGDDITVRDIKLCVKLIDMLVNLPSNDVHYVNFRNAERFVPWIAKMVKDDPEKIKDTSVNDILREEKIWNLYNTIKKYKMRSWWN